MKKVVFVLLAILIAISISAVAGVSYLWGRHAGKNTQNKEATQTASTNAKSNSAESGAVATPPTKTDGIISGMLGYPSEFVPPGRVKAQNITTKQVITLDVEGLADNKGTDKFSVTVPEGTYYLKYEACASPGDLVNCINGYYTSNDGMAQDTSHDLIAVKVAAGQTVKDIHIKDFYGPPSKDPGF